MRLKVLQQWNQINWQNVKRIDWLGVLYIKISSDRTYEPTVDRIIRTPQNYSASFVFALLFYAIIFKRSRSRKKVNRLQLFL